MKTSSLLGPAAAGLSTLLTILPTVHALTFDAVSLPDLDLSALGRVSITGDFDGVSLYEYEGQSEVTHSNGSSSILTPLPNGILTNLSAADAPIQAMCSFTKKDGSFAGIFVGGNFTTLGGVESRGAALFTPNSSTVTALPGLNGSVSAVACDQSTNRVYVGGTFTHKNSSNAMAWSPDDGWTDLSFEGLNGPVESLLKADNGHIIFGGSFDGIGNSSSSDENGLQVVNLQVANITSDAETTLSGYKDPRNVVCSTSGKAAKGKTWLLYDNSPGYWHAAFPFTFNPSKIRLYNTHMDGRGTKSFLIRAIPDDGIMNLTYTDSSGKKAYCDQSCPLSSDPSEKYRDFTLVNPVGMPGLEIQIKEWYGQGAGLNGIEIFQENILSYAIDKFNEPACADTKYPSKSTVTGTWDIDSTYLSTYVTNANDTDASVVFEPDVKESGHYTVDIFIPGCADSDTCDSRGMVNVTATVASGTDASNPSPTTIYQTNEQVSQQQLYSGYVDKASDSFRPSVTLKPIAGQGDINVVAWRVQFNPLFNTTKKATSGSSSSSGSGDLNGLYDYDPTSTTSSTDLDKSKLNKVGTSLNKDASVLSLAEYDGVIYVGGNFSEKSINNIMYIDDGNATAMPGGGLNAEVSAMTVHDEVLYVGGNFTDSSDGGVDGLYHVASYSFSSKKWSALGDGLNGPVSTIYPIELNVSSAVNETTIAVSGDFSQIRATNGNPAVFVPGFAIWIPSNETWLQSLNVTQMEFAGKLSAVASVNETSILAGNLATGGYTTSDAVSLDASDGDLNLIPVTINVNQSEPTTGLVTGIYDSESNRNLTIYGGHFNATTSNGSSISHVAFFNGTDGSVYGLPAGLDSNSTAISMMVYNDTLYVGGNITGTLGSSHVTGFFAYDMTGNKFPSQPWELHGSGDSDVTVNSIARRPGSSDIYIGGSFDTAGSLPCGTVCALDSTANSWSWPGVGIDGTAVALEWANSKTLYAAGNLTISGTKTQVATFDVKSESWTPVSGASQSDIPGILTAFTPAATEISSFWIAGTSSNGSAYVLHYDGSKFQSPGDLFSEGTVIRGLEILPLDKNHASASLLNDDQTLLILGQLVIPDFGNASAALYDGTTVTPFILSSKSDGQAGSMAQLFSENKNPYDTKSSHHSNGIVVLVAFCCALGCVFLIVAAGVIMNKIQRRRQGYSAAPQTFGTDRPTDMQRVPPEYLFNSIGQPNPTAPVI